MEDKSSGVFDYDNKKTEDLIYSIEAEKKHEIRKFAWISALCIIIWLISLTAGICLLAGKIQFGQTAATIFAIIITGILVLIPILLISIFNGMKRSIDVKTKKTLIPELLRTFGDIKWISHDKNKRDETSEIISRTDLDKSGLFMSFSDCFIDDEFKGTYKDVPFFVSEINLCNKIRSRRQEYYVSIFKGVIMNFNINKEIKNRTIVSSKGSLTSKNNSIIAAVSALVVSLEFLLRDFSVLNIIITIGLMIGAYIIAERLSGRNEPLHKINLEDPVFQKKFNAYSSDQIEARCLLTPGFMEKITNLKKAFNSKKIKCSFYDKNFMIAMETGKNVFEIGSFFKSLNNPEVLKNCIGEVKTIYELIDYFKLDEIVHK